MRSPAWSSSSTSARSGASIAELYGEQYLRDLEAEFEMPRHPLVRVHPVTGRPALYLCGDNMHGIVGMTAAESDALLGFLVSRLDNPNVFCRWHWQTHDLAMWDERCTNHRRSATTTRATARSAAASSAPACRLHCSLRALPPRSA